jgi:prepilin-type N-terminal cleavage/methylation domain-containing protein
MTVFWPILDRRGVSLLELMIATMVFSLVAAFGMKFLIFQNQWGVLQEDTAEAQQQVRTASDFMVRELGLLGFGLREGDASILKAEGQEVQFLSNLDAAAARLTQMAQANQRQLSIEYENASDKFKQGKVVSICGLDRCERHTLANDGGNNSLEFEEGLTSPFPPNSTIQIINQVRYALNPAEGTQFRLLRTVDGGSNSVADGLASMELIYLDREGRAGAALPDIHRVLIHLTAPLPRTPGKIRSLTAEVYLRNG